MTVSYCHPLIRDGIVPHGPHKKQQIIKTKLYKTYTSMTVTLSKKFSHFKKYNHTQPTLSSCK